MSKIKHCEHCLAANRPDDENCHYCGHSLKSKTNTHFAKPAAGIQWTSSKWVFKSPRTVGEEMTFRRYQ